MRVRYEIDMESRYADVAPFFEAHPEAMQAVRERAGEREIAIEAMTVRDLCEMLDGRVPRSVMAGSPTVGEQAATVNGLEAALERFATYLRNTDPPETAAQKRAASGMLDTSAEESVLLTCREFYGLHSLEDAQNLTVYEYMIARKAIYNERIQAYNMEIDAMRRARPS